MGFKKYQNQKRIDQISFINPNEAKILENKLFPLFYTSVKNEVAKRLKLNVYINLMESFMLNLLEFSNEKYNFLGKLEKHFKKDFVFKRFLSQTQYTMPSFANLFFLSPFESISRGNFQNNYLKFTPMEIYKKAGYKIYFITGSNGSWHNIANYLRTQGVDEIIDENDLVKEYDGAFLSKNTYGAADEFMYRKIYEILEKIL